MKHIVIDLEMDQIRNNPEARRICRAETIEIGAAVDSLVDFSKFRFSWEV